MTQSDSFIPPFSPEEAAQIAGVADPLVAGRVVQYLANSLAPLEDTLMAPREKIAAAVTMVKAMAPRDPMEAMLIAQAVCSQNLASACMQRATHPNSSPALQDQSMRMAQRFMNLYQQQMRTLVEYRGTPQELRVEGRLEAHRERVLAREAAESEARETEERERETEAPCQTVVTPTQSRPGLAAPKLAPHYPAAGTRPPIGPVATYTAAPPDPAPPWKTPTR